MDLLITLPQMEWSLRKIPLQPSIDETVGLISPDHWSIGSLMICEAHKDKDDEIPSGVVCSWEDCGKTYHLRKRSIPRVNREPEGDFMATRHPDYYGLSRAIWTLSHNVFVKVKSWTEGLTTEADTIRFINKNVPSVPTEKIIYAWIDPAWNRTVMISKRVEGMTYNDAWRSLTTQQKLGVADQVAEHCKALAELTSDYVETVEGGGIAGVYSLRVREAFPFWKPRVEPRVSREDYVTYLTRYDDGVEPPGAQEPLVLQHQDLNPTNFFVSVPSLSNPEEVPKVTAIIDWERVGYLFKWEVSTRPRKMGHFMVDIRPQCEGADDWQWMLSNACVRAGFPLYLDYLKRSGKKIYPHYPNAPAHWLFNSINLLS